METPNIKNLQARVNQIVRDSSSPEEAIKAADRDTIAGEWLREILKDAVIRAWTKKEAREIANFFK